MKKTWISICILFCVMFAMQTAPISEYAMAPATLAEAGVDGIWGGMEITDDGAFDPGSVNDPSSEANLSAMTDKYKSVAQFVIGLLLVTSFFGMIIQITKLSTSGDNDMARRNAIKGILVCGIGIALMGAAEIIVSVLWSTLIP